MKNRTSIDAFVADFIRDEESLEYLVMRLYAHTANWNSPTKEEANEFHKFRQKLQKLLDKPAEVG